MDWKQKAESGERWGARPAAPPPKRCCRRVCAAGEAQLGHCAAKTCPDSPRPPPFLPRGRRSRRAAARRRPRRCRRPSRRRPTARRLLSRMQMWRAAMRRRRAAGTMRRWEAMVRGRGGGRLACVCVRRWSAPGLCAGGRASAQRSGGNASLKVVGLAEGGPPCDCASAAARLLAPVCWAGSPRRTCHRSSPPTPSGFACRV